ncbi:hypothetical protein [Halobiforma nitratireducens]|uniref:Uncharacterized protein n=1 Tax=Halobiforma nitratireducens JCM 10879 TaxID=1227454 RepID=M0L778_9EURY|nr:hypothetical protein [Halobiforma nitratireducens]EMA29401.1 hypothetical protein C446_17102 [Halobiforma nitratireducens JCM 10879]
MHIRSTRRKRNRETTDAGSTSRTGPIGKLAVLAGVVLAVLYLVRRYGWTEKVGIPTVETLEERAPSTESVRERTTDAVPSDFQPIPIGGRSGDGGGEDEDRDGDEVETGSETTEAVSEVIEDAETNVDLTDEARSAEEIAERADEGVPDPGEMAVGEELEDEIRDEEGADDETESGTANDDDDDDDDDNDDNDGDET